jgi:uncharacterized protein (DUF697 family)
MSSGISKAEALARHIVQALSTLSVGRPSPLDWRSLCDLKHTIAGTEAAVQFAAGKGWALVEGGHSVALTDEGRKLATKGE